MGKSDRQARRQGVGQPPQREQVQERIELLRGYRWSWYRACIGVERRPSWLECQSVLSLAGGRNTDRHGGDRGRDLVLYLGRSVCGMKLTELARSVGAKEYASVAMAIRRYAAHLSQNALERGRVKQASELLNVKM